MGSSQDSEYITVNLFPDDTGVTVWLGDPVGYDESGLTQGLVGDLKHWSKFYFDSLNEAHEFKEPNLARQFTKMGNLLAQRVADELGSEHEVALMAYDNSVPSSKFRAAGPASNPRAAAVFVKLNTAIQEEAAQMLRQFEKSGAKGSFGWFSYAPLSGSVVEPQRLDGELSYDFVSDQDQAMARTSWDEKISEKLADLNFEDRMKEVGLPWAESDAEGHMKIRNTDEAPG